MKIRNGFVSNSSSSSFLLKWSELSENEKQKIQTLTERYNDRSRCTGYIHPDNLEEWLEDCYDMEEVLTLIKENSVEGKNDLVLIRESDESMGGEFDDELHKIAAKNIFEFEYH